jgi:hypothetical protein
MPSQRTDTFGATLEKGTQPHNIMMFHDISQSRTPLAMTKSQLHKGCNFTGF